MNKGPICGQFMKKTRGQKSRATVPLRTYKGGHRRKIQKGPECHRQNNKLQACAG